MINKQLLWAGVILGCLLFSGCGGLQPIAPEINLMGLDVVDVTLSHVNLAAEVRLFNPNADKLTIKEVAYTLHLNGVKLSKGRSAREVKVDPEEYGTVTVRMSSAYWDVFRLLNKIQDNEELRFKIQGKVLVGGYGLLGQTFNFEKEGLVSVNDHDKLITK